MREVKVQRRFKCDFCKRRSVKSAMERHEKICFRNPNRFCDECKNTGIVRNHVAGDGITEPAYYDEHPCVYCSKRDPEKEKQIDEFYALQTENKQ